MSTTGILKFIRLNSRGDDPRDELRRAESAIATLGWAKRAGLALAWPLTSTQTARLLRDGCDYDVTTRGLHDLIRRGLLVPPAKDEREALEWSAIDVLTAADLLEMRQQWKLRPSIHDAKKQKTRLALERLAAKGKLAETLQTGVGYDPRHLIVALVNCPHAAVRQQLADALVAVLAAEHGIKV